MNYFQGKTRNYRARRSVVRGSTLRNEIPDVHLTDSTRIKQLIPDFDPELEFNYSPRELLLLAEKILLEDPKKPYEEPSWLNGGSLRHRTRREIYVQSGTPDPSIESGMFWRTHPRGRVARENRAERGFKDSFYKESGYR
jgi:hypothetical protein